jgi:hypothetical protein
VESGDLDPDSAAGALLNEEGLLNEWLSNAGPDARRGDRMS